jgi:alpha-ketoglutarate-dependent taurine dioxygenase
MNVPKQVICKLLDATAANSKYTVPANVKALIKGIFLNNPTAAAVAVVCRISPLGGGALTQFTKTVMAYEALPCYELDNQILEATDVIDFTGAGVNCILTAVLLPE